MKSEYEIAKQNVKNWGKSSEDRFIRMYYYNCERHKLTCQRFLEFLKKVGCQDKKDVGLCRCVVCEKERDLKNAIKHYEENGIQNKTRYRV